jgi:hypothetical protein
MLERAVDMLAVAVQLPAAVLADEASARAAVATIAHRAVVTAFMPTMKPPVLASMIETSVSTRHCACLTTP